ncbi:S9 family peptidase [Actinophytocola algeriensis]|uniref:Dipeptidyl-peptidase-4 n=1 Tax=Actinophytocola algeriensis TaxID=1768010 RepID=A0A7W7QAF6_9PSEU|nr:prolyl oligopeptidase family serine peptidase [Actinophytocola algeriensis]MBB4910022.1 dipeptidyl-peptidase-4 [Actinophytocola algeriensis]MBE1476012.1 dipeptidyl-peptidase-4 [Actinophytocola algeriensis]
MTNSFLRLQARTQRFTLGTPRGFQVSPDGSRVLFLRSASGEDRQHILWKLDVTSGEETRLADPDVLLGGHEELSPEERARRERSREQAGGVVGNATDADVRIAAFALSGKVFVADAVSGEVRELATEGPAIDPRPDPTGTHVAYVAGNALRVVAVDGSGDRTLAEPDGPDQACGVAEFIAAEEMGRARGFWWSPDGTRLLVAFTDKSAVRRWHIADPANPDAEPNVVSYPAAGTDNVTVRLAVIGLDGSRVNVDRGEYEYFVTAHWSRGGPLLIAQQPRDQRRMEVRAVDADTGATTVLAEDSDDRWVEIVPGVPAWTADERLVRVAVSDGWNRLVVDGKEVTPPGLQVRSVLDVGTDVLFTASADDPTQVHVYRWAGWDADGVTRVSTSDGVHGAARGGDVTVLVAWSLEHAGPRVSVLRGGDVVGEVASLAVEPPLTPNVRLMTVGERDLRVALLYPAGHQPGTKVPVLLDPYGGPHAQRVLSTRNSYLGAQWLADQGFAVLIADGRGTPGRGAEWEREIAFDFAGATLQDQVDALQAVAASEPDLDLSTVAIRGWSYGGYLSALAVLRRPDVFHAAIAGAPVTEWRLYDTHYTERYLGHPDEKPEVYDRNSLIDDAPGLDRPLLIIHGLADDNVVVAHSVRLSAALVAAGRPHALLPLPGVTHMTPQDDEVAENFMLMQISWLRTALGVA